MPLRMSLWIVCSPFSVLLSPLSRVFFSCVIPAVPMGEGFGEALLHVSSVAVALRSVSIFFMWLQRGNVPIFMLCVVFFFCVIA